jgi:hypothetical protein
MAALMSSEMDRTEQVVKFIHEAKAMGIEVLPPDVNESNMFFTVVGPNIRFGLGAVKGVGESAIESVLEARRRIGRYKSLLQFCEEVDLRACNKKVLEALIKSGSFDFLGTTRRALFEQLESTADSAQRTKDEKERGQHSLFGVAQTLLSVPAVKAQTGVSVLHEWPEEEKLRYEKETLGFYVSGHPLNRYADELKLFAGANTDTLHRFVDQTVNIGGIVSQMKKSKIKKGPNEGKMMAKFVLDDQYGSVDVVVFSDLYAKYAKWLDNGVAVLLTAAVKDTGGQVGGRSASLQSAEQSAQRIDDEYGGHPEDRAARISAYEVTEDDLDRDPKEVEREKYGADVDKYTPSLFGPAGDAPADVVLSREDCEGLVPSEEDAFNEAAASIEQQPEPRFAAHAAAFTESPITPELNALEIVPLDGIRDKKVKEITLEVRYADMDEDRIKKIREIFEDHAGDIPVSVTIVDLPPDVANGAVRMRINQHFRVQPGPALTAALEAARVRPQYIFDMRSNNHAA